MKIDTTSGEYDYTFLSLGAGVQSSALLVLGCIEEEPRVPRPDICLFADTGDEPQYVYDYVEQLTAFAAREGVEVQVVQAGVLSDDVKKAVEAAEDDPDAKVQGWVSVPLYTRRSDQSEGMRTRACTRMYKIQPLHQEVRKILGYKPRQRVKEKVRSLVGITIDESQRMKQPQVPWLTNSYPLVDMGIHRNDCFRIIDEAGLPAPKKSACVYCPYHSDTYWQWLKDEQPAEFQKAVEFDELIRAEATGFPAFVHRAMQPLSEVEFNAGNRDQIDLWTNECEGMCGV